MRKRMWIALGLIGLLLLGTVVLLHAAGAPRLYVVNSLSGALSIIDTGKDAVVGTIPLHGNGYRVALAPNGQIACITLAQTVAGGKPQENTGLALVDLAKSRVDRRLPLDIAPLANVHLSSNGRLAYVVTAGAPGARNSVRGRVFTVEVPGGKVKSTVLVGLNPLDSVMTPDGRRLYTADWGSRSVSVVDLRDGKLRDTIPMGWDTVRSLAMSPNGKKVYFALERLAVTPAQTSFNSVASNANQRANATVQNAMPAGEELLWEVDTTSGKVEKIALGGLNPVYALAVSADSRWLYAYGRASQAQAIQQAAGAVYVLVAVDLDKQLVARRLGNFGYISAMVLHPDGAKIYLIGTPGTPAEEAQARTKMQRAQVALRDANNPAGSKGQTSPQQAQVINTLSDLDKTVTVLDTKTGRVLKVITIGSLPQGAAMGER